jgi:hypothetical protein
MRTCNKDRVPLTGRGLRLTHSVWTGMHHRLQMDIYPFRLSECVSCRRYQQRLLASGTFTPGFSKIYYLSPVLSIGIPSFSARRSCMVAFSTAGTLPSVLPWLPLDHNRKMLFQPSPPSFLP